MRVFSIRENVHCPKCLEEWYADSDEVGELCGYCHEGLVEEGELEHPTGTQEIFELSKQMFPPTSDLGLAGWILPDGTLLSLTLQGTGRDRDHGEVARLFKEPMERWEAVKKFREMGAIRMFKPRGDFASFQLSDPPTQKQYEQLRRILESTREVEVEVVGDARGNRFYHEYNMDETMVEEVWRDISAALQGGGRSELMQFHNTNVHKSASALPRGTFEPLQDIMKRLSSSLDNKGDVDDALETILELLRPLKHFRHIKASTDRYTQSIVFTDDENEEACALSLYDGSWIVEEARFERLDRIQKAAGSIQWKKT